MNMIKDLTKEYLLFEIREKHGKLNDSTIYTLGFLDIDTLDEYVCVVDTSYKNYKRSGWDKLLHTKAPYGVYTNLKLSDTSVGKKGEKIIHGDSKPIQVEALTETQIEEIVVALVEEKKQTKAKSQIASILSF
jgi:hypothetical protein